MAKTIGIDLGTTNSCVAVLEAGKPVIIPNSEGFRTTPSVVAVSKTGERLVGDSAKRQAVTNAQNTVSSIKRQMGSDARMTLGGKKYSPQEVSAMILQRLKRDAESYLGETVNDAVITVPAYFSDAQRQATKDAGLIAGLNVQRIINEPTAAALAYGLDHEAAQKIMVYDLGGGTFDVSVIEIGDGVIEVLATSGDNHLGGDDFDERVASHLVAEFKKQEKVDLSKDMVAMQRVREAAEKAKIELSAAVTTSISLPFVSVSRGEPVHMETTLSRAKFDELTADLVERTAVPVRNALQDAGLTASALSKVLLVGGSTRILAVQEMVRKLTGKEPSKGLNPDECVAQGAAIQGGTLSGQLAVGAGNQGGGILLLDVTPLTLSIETVGGVATPLIDRNTTIPTKYSRIFSTAANFQTSVEVNVLQGERKFAKDNKSLGRFRLDGIKRAMRGVPQIEVTFEIDANGIVKVSARDLGTGREQHVTITASSNLSDSDIQRAVRDAQEYESQDRQRKDRIDIRNDAEVLAAQVNAALDKFGKELSKEEKHRVKEDLALLRKRIGKTKPDDISDAAAEELRQAMDTLKASSERLLSIGAAGGAGASGDVSDAEYSEDSGDSTL